MKRSKKLNISATHLILLSFLEVIIVGALLLMLPISSASGESTSFVDALFTATTSLCVTGLVVVPTVSYWSVFGQIVILLLIQIGGLGVITVMSALALSLHKKMKLSDSMLIQDSFNINTLSGLTSFVKKIVIGTAIVEGIGALLYMTVFIPEFGARGIWISIFNSVSAFCNAGLDIIGENSLCDYVSNPIINATTCILIVLGGLGYIVWWDVLRVMKESKRRGGKMFIHLTLHSKIVLSATAILIFFGAVLYFVFEYNNPMTMENLSLYEKIQASFFQSVTTRTAGFATIPQENFTNASVIISILLMFIGGSPVGTAGGVKTVTFVVVFASAFAAIKNKNEAGLFNRSISKQAVSKSIGVICMSFIIVFVSTVALSVCASHATGIDIIFETVSATATVGLTRNLTYSLSSVGKLIIAAAMYLGRVGPISLAIAFNIKRESKNIIKNPTEEISVG